MVESHFLCVSTITGGHYSLLIKYRPYLRIFSFFVSFVALSVRKINTRYGLATIKIDTLERNSNNSIDNQGLF